MRRRADGWLNATQILKVAGLDKPARTRVLERDIQKGIHEKVQGGYGKYQGKRVVVKTRTFSYGLNIQLSFSGTWVPPDLALTLARHYSLEDQLRPIIEYEPSSDSPPPAPKHPAASTNLLLPVGKHARHRSPSVYSSVRTRSVRPRSESRDSLSDSGMYSPGDAVSGPSASSPVASHTSHSVDEGEIAVASPSGNITVYPEAEDTFANIMLEYFIADGEAQVPSILTEPPPGLDVNVRIDSAGHSPLHWAAALGRTRVLKLLLSAGANPDFRNHSGQTALMRAASFPNCYDRRMFHHVYEALRETTLNVDDNNRHILHYIADLGLSQGRLHAARYYMETVLTRLEEDPLTLKALINSQDVEGDTPITMAARCRSKRMVKALSSAGADPDIKNRDGKSARDYIMEDEKFRSSPLISGKTLLEIGVLHPKTQATLAAHRTYSASGQIAEKFDELLAAFDSEIATRSKDIDQARMMLGQLEKELEETQKSIDLLTQKTIGRKDAEKAALEKESITQFTEYARLGMLQWIQEEECREQDVWSSSQGLTRATIATASPSALKGSSIDDDLSDLAQLYSNVPPLSKDRAQLCDDLRAELRHLEDQTGSMIEDYVHARMDAGDTNRIKEYRKVIFAALPGTNPAELDDLRIMEQIAQVTASIVSILDTAYVDIL